MSNRITHVTRSLRTFLTAVIDSRKYRRQESHLQKLFQRVDLGNFTDFPTFAQTVDSMDAIPDSLKATVNLKYAPKDVPPPPIPPPPSVLLPGGGGKQLQEPPLESVSPTQTPPRAPRPSTPPPPPLPQIGNQPSSPPISSIRPASSFIPPEKPPPRPSERHNGLSFGSEFEISQSDEEERMRRPPPRASDLHALSFDASDDEEGEEEEPRTKKSRRRAKRQQHSPPPPPPPPPAPSTAAGPSVLGKRRRRDVIVVDDDDNSDSDEAQPIEKAPIPKPPRKRRRVSEDRAVAVKTTRSKKKAKAKKTKKARKSRTDGEGKGDGDGDGGPFGGNEEEEMELLDLTDEGMREMERREFEKQQRLKKRRSAAAAKKKKQQQQQKRKTNRRRRSRAPPPPPPPPPPSMTTIPPPPPPPPPADSNPNVAPWSPFEDLRAHLSEADVNYMFWSTASVSQVASVLRKHVGQPSASRFSSVLISPLLSRSSPAAPSTQMPVFASQVPHPQPSTAAVVVDSLTPLKLLFKKTCVDQVFQYEVLRDALLIVGEGAKAGDVDLASVGQSLDPDFLHRTLIPCLERGDLEVANLLLQLGAQMNVGQVPGSCDARLAEKMFDLCGLGRYVDDRDEDQVTLLHRALRAGNKELMRLLILKYDARASLPNGNGETVEQLAVMLPDKSMAHCLFEVYREKMEGFRARLRSSM